METNNTPAPTPAAPVEVPGPVQGKKFWQVRHGDLTICRARNLFAKAAPVPPEEQGILAYGEATGHAHRLSTREINKGREALWFEVKAEAGQARVSHEEHRTIALPPGFYRSVPKRQYTPDGWETVRD